MRLVRDIIEVGMTPSLADFKRHIRLTGDDSDAILLSYLRAATVAAEHHIGRMLAPAAWSLTTEFSQAIILPYISSRYPLGHINSVQVDGVAVPFSVDGNKVILEADSGKEVTLSYVASPVQVEDDIQHAILLTAARYYNNPVDSVDMLPSVATNLLANYRKWGMRDGE